jgi:beta-glucosidase
MGRVGETYGEDATLSAALGAKYVKGCQQESSGRKTDCVAKHFLGFHLSKGGIHTADCEISGQALRETYAKPFQAAITNSGLRGIMPCYNVINGEPISSSKELLSEFLRYEMGFDGLIASDYDAIKHLHTVQRTAESLETAGLQALAAGMDMELPIAVCYNEELSEMFSKGDADIDILNKACLRVLTAKFRMGLFENPFAASESDALKVLGTDESKEISLLSAKESLVLLRNDGVLPIKNPKNPKRIAVVGCHANSARYFFGGYTHFSMAEGGLAARATMAGTDGIASANDNPGTTLNDNCIPGTLIQDSDQPKFEELLNKMYPRTNSLIEEIKNRFPDATVAYSRGYSYAGSNTDDFDNALKIAKNSDLVILTLGGKHGTSSIATTGEGIDATNINLPECQERFIEKLSSLSVPSIGVHLDGRPISSDAADKYLSAVIEAWNPAEFGAKAIVDVLSGEYNPSGKLPISVAHNAGQIPVFYNHLHGSGTHQSESIGFEGYMDCSHEPRYAFGFGLSYTTFEYQNLIISEKIISFDVKNAGNQSGTEVAQLYFSDQYASMARPCMELFGFRRVSLEPGETKKLSFEFDPTQFAFCDKQLRWVVEAGDFEIMVASSSDNIRLRGIYSVPKTSHVDGRNRKLYSI